MSNWLKSIFSLVKEGLGTTSFSSTEDLPFKDKYDSKELLGVGTFFLIRLAQGKADPEKHFAIKTIDRAMLEEDDEVLYNEMAKMTTLKHSNIVPLVEFYTNDKIEVHLVMDLIPGGKLLDAIVEKDSYTEREVVNIIKQLLSAVAFMHDHGIVHYNLKPDNILCYSPGNISRVMIKDFEWSQILQRDELMKMSQVNTSYTAPEMMSPHPVLGKEIDVWAIGVISYILLCGYHPFRDDHEGYMSKKIMKGDYQFNSPYWDDISFAAQDFIVNLLHVDIRDRSTCQEALEHSWISGDIARNENIHGFVSEQLRKHFVASRVEWGEPSMSARVTVMKRPQHFFFESDDEEEGEFVAAASVGYGYEPPTSPKSPTVH